MEDILKKKTVFLLVIATAVVMLNATIFAFYALMGFNAQKTKDVLRFFGALRFIETQYVRDVDYTNLIDGAISGMVKTLDDPHSIYLDPKMYELMRSHTEGSFGGVGIVMGFKDNKITVISVMEGTPSEAAGIKTGDEIIAVDGTPTNEIEPEEVVLHIRGEIGTDVTLKIRRAGEEDKDYVVRRATIQVHTVAGQMLPDTDGIGYIRIASFSEHTADEFKDAYHALEKDGVKGMIIDLRENPGGLVTSCVAIANMVVPKGPVVSVVQKDGTREEYKSDLSEEKYPLVVLIDGNSASASEILAGALQDTGAATIVGETSYGKGSVQVILPLYDDDALKLTIAKYYTPSGRSIDGTGIEPDVRVEPQADGAQDVQLLKAIDVMKGKLAGIGANVI
ncbi:peptidase, S41 family [Selenomonas sputigena ATCC 35185]|uniref:Peptidase, S41 family n=1 Tax=Selenomonas sputigena (strain ATCC 35185 / DSM 20758 / CCUG 44933 / VPI D19B-28) TaxID=546271 RepID=C9LUC3_SELS3|nr:S41 family peptidase [Selenomonas sputigena]EEX77654.1 peptidase, S41 family [Selenomonas sputigena ATCC 35185]